MYDDGRSLLDLLCVLLLALAVAIVIVITPLCAPVPRVVGVWTFALPSSSPLAFALLR